MTQASAEKLEHTGPAEKGESGLSATKKAVGRNARAALAKKKRNRAVSPEYQLMRGERVKVGEREGDQSESMKREGWNPP